MTRRTKIAVTLYSVAAVCALIAGYLSWQSGSLWSAVGSIIVATLAVILAFITFKRRREQ